MGVVFVLCVWWANIIRGPEQEFYPVYFYATILLVYAVHQVIHTSCTFTVYLACFGHLKKLRVIA